MSPTSREIGTLVVVILKAKHLPNKRHIGKQDPYCAVTFNGEKRKTRAIKRGGQHPEWDEEVRFELYEDADENDRMADDLDTPPPPPPKSEKGPRKIKGGKTMILSCYADDPREPDLIGEVAVDLTEVLTKGETDEWFTLMNKEKYCGEVYLELTFWLNEKPPGKKTPKPVLHNKQYGGPGSFVPISDSPTSSPSGPNGYFSSSLISSTSSNLETRDPLPESLRPSQSLAKLDLYVPPYERNTHESRMSAVDQIANDFGELGISNHRRRGSFPPLHGGHTPRPPSTIGFPNHLYDEGQYLSGGSTHVTIPGSHAVNSYQPPYEAIPSAAGTIHHAQSRTPRYTIPPSSSGFVPLANPTIPGLVSLHSSEPSGFPPPARTPVPMAYPPPHFSQHSRFVPIPSQTPLPAGLGPSQQPVSQSFTPSQVTLQYPSYVSQTPVPTPSQQYIIPPHPLSSAVPSQAVPSQTYQGHPPLPVDESVPSPSLLPRSSSLSSSVSRPLPPQPHNPAPLQTQFQLSHSLPPSGSSLQFGPFSPSLPIGATFPTTNYQSVPPPPPLPTSNPTPQPFPTSTQHLDGSQTGPPSLPPPPPMTQRPSRRASLPQPPVTYRQHQPSYQHVPPPPPLPSNIHQGASTQVPFPNHQPPPPPPPSSQITGQSQPQNSGLHPRLPTHGDDHGDRFPESGGQHQGNYAQPGWA